MTAFLKMNGLGNDFAVVDARTVPFALSPERIASLAPRASGIGFDQFIVIAPPKSADAAATMRIINADGGEVEACGNAARCVAALLLDETGDPAVAIDSLGGTMTARRGAAGRIAVDMGKPRFDAASIPLADTAADAQALALPGFADRFGLAACANVGNPHAVFFVPSLAEVPLAEVGPALEHHPAFPERANISFVEDAGPDRLRAIVWERGVGPTRACGTAACAIGALAHRLGRTGPAVTIELPGGPLSIDVSSGRIVMEGPFELEYAGTITAGGFVRDTSDAA
ncbi:diaminopimelate epimerase [Acuticoccus sp. MNP-M23]|uniref:diaminopimelate epimerase n=1 Tax=Acuticoccus sp. MNP-M23 TaxID=3072793 RepID=UPI00281605F7|nr:diaminopimelate epimerase [Acuticoccus sp. MNP-M23]WMS44371.1 diaminopimelate epimerase [Acuticoccus sp. MNP-M23]